MAAWRSLPMSFSSRLNGTQSSCVMAFELRDDFVDLCRRELDASSCAIEDPAQDFLSDVPCALPLFQLFEGNRVPASVSRDLRRGEHAVYCVEQRSRDPQQRLWVARLHHGAEIIDIALQHREEFLARVRRSSSSGHLFGGTIQCSSGCGG